MAACSALLCSKNPEQAIMVGSVGWKMGLGRGQQRFGEDVEGSSAGDNKDLTVMTHIFTEQTFLLLTWSCAG